MSYIGEFILDTSVYIVKVVLLKSTLETLNLISIYLDFFCSIHVLAT